MGTAHQRPPRGFCLHLLQIPTRSASHARWRDGRLPRESCWPGNTGLPGRLSSRGRSSSPTLVRTHRPSPFLTTSCKSLPSCLENVTEGFSAFTSQQVMN